MLNEELKDQILQTKLVYLNGYLASLAAINSFSVIGMNYKLFAYNFSDGNIEGAIQNNSYELFGVYPNDWDVELTEVKDWKERLEIELVKPVMQQPSILSDKENETIRDLKSRIKNSINDFITLLEKEFAEISTNIYESTVTKGGFYRIMGIDLVFEIEETKIIFLQILGND
ncbi:hypothetical protein MQX03_14945 [Chryseobacterium aahli]|uniref:hypothetical protein n=1 Tax=Chryseobacterium TaxID=59732 RepID=UPI000F0CE47A|nr:MULTISPECIES: hypothetical protein [Chryseobacterium]AYN01542.1 hypothetical protein EAG08_15625 [Chryseobacterium sp. 3008163]MCI3938498.1 hypothetical protein [Chryseobacterium aahli]